MMSARHLWIFFRYTRWLLWLATIGYSIEFLINRQHHMDAFGRLALTTEFLMFTLPLAAAGRPSGIKLNAQMVLRCC
jgi:hypothetical protein